MTTAERILEILVDHLGVPDAEVTPTAHFVNDLGADSLDTVEIIMEVEREFDVLIPDDLMESLMTINALVAHLDKA